MKKTFLALALAGTFGIAAAQSMTTGMPATKPTVNVGGLGAPVASVQAAAPTAAPTAALTAGPAGAASAAKPDPHINPFNGKLQSVEQIQRDLEETRMQTLLLEERLKQTNLAEELKTVPLRKAVEAAQATTAVKKEEASQKEIEQNMRAPKVPAGAHAAAAAAAAAASGAHAPVSVKKKAHAAVSKAAAKSASDKPAESSAVTPAPAPLPRPTLVSILNVGGSRSAVLEFAGGTLVVGEGESTPFGVLHIHDQNSADVGGTQLHVHNATMARFIVSDAKVVAAPGAQQSTGAAAVGTPVAPAPQAQAQVGAAPALGLPAQANGPLPALPLPPSTPALAAPTASSPATLAPGSKAQLPPLQLPPGVSVLPPPR